MEIVRLNRWEYRRGRHPGVNPSSCPLAHPQLSIYLYYVQLQELYHRSRSFAIFKTRLRAKCAYFRLGRSGRMLRMLRMRKHGGDSIAAQKGLLYTVIYLEMSIELIEVYMPLMAKRGRSCVKSEKSTRSFLRMNLGSC